MDGYQKGHMAIQGFQAGGLKNSNNNNNNNINPRKKYRSPRTYKLLT